jgi:hypothetical protein
MRALTLALLLAAALPAQATAAGWTPPVRFKAQDEAPRAAIAADGTGVVAWGAADGSLRVVSRADGRFGAPARLGGGAVVAGAARDGAAIAGAARGAALSDPAVAAAPRGAALVAWVARDGIYAALRRSARGRWRMRRVAPDRGSEISGLQVAHDPRGGWVIAERAYPTRQGGQPYRLRALSLDAAGRPGQVQELGLGHFGIDARPTFALAVDGAGTARLVAETESPSGADEPPPHGVVVFSRPHGGAFGPAIGIGGPNGADPRVAVGPGGRYAVTWTDTVRAGDTGRFGRPMLAVGQGEVPLGAGVAPRISRPGRVFGPSTAWLGRRPVLVWQQRDAAAPFSPIAPAWAAILDGGAFGRSQRLTRSDVSEPVVVALRGGHALALWAGTRRFGAALSDSGGRFRPTTTPPGTASKFHFNSTNRDLRTAGRYAILTWSAAGRVRISVRRF